MFGKFNFTPALTVKPFYTDADAYVETQAGYVGPLPANADRTQIDADLTATAGTGITAADFLKRADEATIATAWLRIGQEPSRAEVRPTGEVDGFWPVFQVSLDDPRLCGRAALPPHTFLTSTVQGLRDTPMIDGLMLEESPIPSVYVDGCKNALIAKVTSDDRGCISVFDVHRLDGHAQAAMPGRFVVAAGPDRRRLRNLAVIAAHDEPKIASWAAKRARLDPMLPAFAREEASTPVGPRDTQKRTLYRWEDRLWQESPWFQEGVSEQTAQNIVNDLWRELDLAAPAPPVRISERAHKTSRSSAREGIVLAGGGSGQGKRKGVLLHELGHEIVRRFTNETTVQAHGPEYAGVVCALYAWAADQEIEDTMSDAHNHGVRVDTEWCYRVISALTQNENFQHHL